MSKKMFPICLIALFLILPSFALSQSQEIKDYKVMKGDTLWEISGKELSDPFLWPKIWKENPGLKNPDKIYPDQTIKIPLYLIQQKEKQAEPIAEPVVESKPVAEAVKKAVPVKPHYLIDKNTLMASGFISNSVNSIGQITGSPDSKSLFGNNDLIYVKTDKPANIGDKFYIIHAGEKVIHPATKKPAGYVVEVLGIAEISKFEYGETIAKITQAFRDINTGDLFDTYYEIPQPLASKNYRKPAVEGYIIAARSIRLINGNLDIVYIDKGGEDGIEIGDVIKTIEIKESVSYDKPHKVPNGIIQVINYKDNTATAIVRENTFTIAPGNLITKAE